MRRLLKDAFIKESLVIRAAFESLLPSDFVCQAEGLLDESSLRQRAQEIVLYEGVGLGCLSFFLLLLDGSHFQGWTDLGKILCRHCSYRIKVMGIVINEAQRLDAF